MKKTVTVVGAGFAGLTLAYYLEREGFHVHVVERQGKSGGLLGTVRTDFGPVETGANALLSNRAIERMFEELELTLANRLPTRKKRYIFGADGPARWPFDLKTSARLGWRAARLMLGDRGLAPTAKESIAQWGDRFGGEEFTDELLAPALLGIYAGDPDRLSAQLILRGFLKQRNRRGKHRGSIAPEGGMGQFMRKLTKHLAHEGVKIDYEQKFAMPEFITTPLVIATSAWGAADILKESRPKVAAELNRCESLSLVSQTAFFRSTPNDLQGFGCLFPKSAEFNHLGVLFNTSIFENRASPGYRSETWMIGGAGHDDITARDDARLLEQMLKDRERLCGSTDRPEHVHVTRWPRAIPHYTTDWARVLDKLEVKPPLYLHGNYLGGLGLTRIHTRSRTLARQIRNNHG